MRLSKKLAIAAVSTVATVSVASAAFAYWTTGGSGSGSASVGSATSNLTIDASQQTAADRLIPAGSAVALKLTVDNGNGYSVALKDHTVSIDAGSVKCGVTTVPDSWFSLDSNKISAADVIAAHGDNVVVNSSGVTIKMNDDTSTNQDVCQGADLSFSLHVSGAVAS